MTKPINEIGIQTAMEGIRRYVEEGADLITIVAQYNPRGEDSSGTRYNAWKRLCVNIYYNHEHVVVPIKDDTEKLQYWKFTYKELSDEARKEQKRQKEREKEKLKREKEIYEKVYEKMTKPKSKFDPFYTSVSEIQYEEYRRLMAEYEATKPSSIVKMIKI